MEKRTKIIERLSKTIKNATGHTKKCLKFYSELPTIRKLETTMCSGNTLKILDVL